MNRREHAPFGRARRGGALPDPVWDYGRVRRGRECRRVAGQGKRLPWSGGETQQCPQRCPLFAASCRLCILRLHVRWPEEPADCGMVESEERRGRRSCGMVGCGGERREPANEYVKPGRVP